MNFIKFLFKSNRNEVNLSNNFHKSIEKIISEIEASDKILNDDEYYKLISNNTLNRDEVNEIYIFLPIVFTQLLIPIKWNKWYIEQNKTGKKIN